MIAVFQKELRDCLRWSPLGMVLGLVMLWMALPDEAYSATSMETSLLSLLGLAACLVAIGLGLLQSLPDARNDSRGYLLHRPIKPNKLFWAKVAAAYVAYAISLAVPVIVAMIYLQTKGIEKLPTNALQVIPFLMYSCVAFLFHPTVLWIVSRDARWVGTRLLPAVGVIAVAYLMAISFDFNTPDSLIIVITVLAIFVGFTAVTLLSARHAFVHQAQLPTRSSPKWRSWPCMIGLAISGAVFYSVVFGLVSSNIPSTPKDNFSYKLSLDDKGNWRQLATRRSKFNWNDVQHLTRDVDGKDEFTEVDKGWASAQSSTLADFNLRSPYQIEQFRQFATVNSKMAASKNITLVSHQDRLLLYDNSKSKGLISIVTPNGSSTTWDEAKGRFTRLGVLTLHEFGDSNFNVRDKSNPVLIDENGTYQLIADECRVERLTSDSGVEKAMLLLAENDSPASIWTLANSKLTQHEIEFEPSTEGFVIDWNYVKKEGKFFLPPVKKVLSNQSWQIDPLKRNESLRVTRTPDGQHAIIRENWTTAVSDYAMLGETGGVEQIGSVQLPQQKSELSDTSIGWILPPVWAASMVAIMHLLYSASSIGLLGLIASIACHSVLAAALTWWLGGRYQFTKREKMLWAAAGLSLGLGAMIGIVSIYRRHTMAECPRCSDDRRIDLESCEHCGKLWDPPEEEGIEIFERDRSLKQLEAPSLS